MRILLVTPPMVQVNAPYPATAYLAGSLRKSGHLILQADASLMLALRLFSKSGLESIHRVVKGRKRPPRLSHFLRHYPEYLDTVDAVIHFLQGHNPTLALRIVSRSFLPEGPRLAGYHAPAPHSPLLATLSTHDTAIHLASLYLDDLTDVIHDGVDSRFELARHGEKLAASAPTFDAIVASLNRKPTLVDNLIDDIARDLFCRHTPDLIGFTLPFPGNVYGALRMARAIKQQSPESPIVMGGGYVNTELRDLCDPRFFDYTDYLTLDDGEIPLLRIIDHTECQMQRKSRRLIKSKRPASPPDLESTFIRQKGRVVFVPPLSPPFSLGNHPSFIPDFSGLPLRHYFSLIEFPNPMHRIWSCGRWNRIMLAHGCYWHRCAFCDTELDYIQRYYPISISVLIGQIQDIIRQTGETGFHFIDEAMPPALLRNLSKELIRRKLNITWWGNIRFDKAFTPELVALMARSGCIAVTGGLEAPTDRLLSLLDKGFTLRQAARVTHAFAEAGILVHAYLMYGCPSETVQDTVDSLEFVRQLFEAGCIQSAYWHRFALTLHSPMYQHRARFGITVPSHPRATFARNEVPFKDTIHCDHTALGRGLRKALYNFMHDSGLDLELQDWFDVRIPPPSIPTDYVAKALEVVHQG